MSDLDEDMQENVSFGTRIMIARQRSQYTSNHFAQLMGIKMRTLEDYENDVVVPEKKHIAKMNRFLTNKLPYPQKKTNS